MGGPTSFFHDPFGGNARYEQNETSRQQFLIRKRDQLTQQVQTDQDLTDADRQRFQQALSSISTSSFQNSQFKDSQTVDDLASQIADAILAQKKKRESAEKQRALINEAPGTRLTQDVNVATLGASPLVTATANPGLV